jgi:hypothetical protein
MPGLLTYVSAGQQMLRPRRADMSAISAVGPYFGTAALTDVKVGTGGHRECCGGF